MEELRRKKGFICDMDGVIYHGNRLLPGVKEFVEWLYREQKNFLFLTNSSERSPKELQQKLKRMGLDVDESHFYTSALATARFISSQSPESSAYVIGGAGLILRIETVELLFDAILGGLSRVDCAAAQFLSHRDADQRSVAPTSNLTRSACQT